MMAEALVLVIKRDSKCTSVRWVRFFFSSEYSLYKHCSV